jgi:hypothetical protein
VLAKIQLLFLLVDGWKKGLSSTDLRQVFQLYETNVKVFFDTTKYQALVF